MIQFEMCECGDNHGEIAVTDEKGAAIGIAPGIRSKAAALRMLSAIVESDVAKDETDETISAVFVQIMESDLPRTSPPLTPEETFKELILERLFGGHRF